MRIVSRRTSNRKRTLRIAFFAVLFILLGILLPQALSYVAVGVMYPVHGINVWLKESGDFIPTLVRDKQALDTRIKELENALIVSERSSLTQQRLIEENNRLRQLFNADGIERIAATVIARPNELPYDLLQIDRGTDQGVLVGAPVFVGTDLVIGLVVHTGPTFAFVQLVTSPGFEATAFVAGPNITATIEGLGGGQSRVRVPQGIPMRVGNLVHLPSVEPGVFGRIVYVENQPTQPEQYGYIATDVPISGLHYVAVGNQSQVTKSVEVINQRVLEQMQQALLVDRLQLSTTTTTTSTSSESIVDQVNSEI